MNEKFLITGATGFLGRAVVAELGKTGSRIRALVLESDPLVGTLPRDVEVFRGDVCDDESLERFFAETGSDTVVIHCAGIVSIASRPGEGLYRVNVGGTKNLLRHCEARRVRKLVYVSSVHAIPEKPKGETMDEEAVFSPYKVRGAYAKSKAIATALVFEAAKRGLNASVVYPSGIIGPGDIGEGSITKMLVSFLAGRMPFAVKGGYDFADVRDVAAGIAACAERGEAGKGYILSGHYASIRDILRLTRAEAGIRRAPLCLPLCLAQLAAPLAERRNLRKKRPLYFTPYSVAVLGSNGSFDRNAAAARFGYAPRPLQISIRDTVLWIREHALPRKIPAAGAN